MIATADVDAAQVSSVQERLLKTSLVIPTYNASDYWPRLRTALDAQGMEKHQIIIVDSASTDGTELLAQEAGYQVIRIPKESFRHGVTRRMAAKLTDWAEFLIFMTQDAIPSGSDAIASLLAAFDDPTVGVAYGRQLPRPQADAIEAHARLYNYSCISETRDFTSRELLGFRAIFCSNSFAAYRRSALEEVGNFPDVIVSEEVTVVARMLIAGWKIAYQAESQVVHSHPIGVRREFSRYFDIAVHHSREAWILETFGRVGGEGTLFVFSEMRYLLRHSPRLVPLAILKNVAKWLGYHTGLLEAYLPIWLKRQLSAQAGFWDQPVGPRRRNHGHKTATE